MLAIIGEPANVGSLGKRFLKQNMCLCVVANISAFTVNTKVLSLTEPALMYILLFIDDMFALISICS